MKSQTSVTEIIETPMSGRESEISGNDSPSSGPILSPPVALAALPAAKDPYPVASPPTLHPDIGGLLLGLLAATAYSVSNLALRGLSDADGGSGWDMWVAGTKAVPTFVAALVLLWMRQIRKLPTFAAWEIVWPIALAACFNQLGGNFAFQMSLRAIGLAITVPICFASIICSGAVVGRLVLNDSVSIRTAISMGLMVASIVFLSAGANSRTAPPPAASELSLAVSTADIPPSANEAAHQLSVPAGVALSIISGLCYGVSGVFIRKSVRSQMPVEATLFLFSAAGVLILCPLSLLLLPVAAITATTPYEWMVIVVAGVFNALGFFAITHAMRHLTITRANVINASQNALCALGAVLVFGEQISLIAMIGVALTITGLLTLDRR